MLRRLRRRKRLLLLKLPLIRIIIHQPRRLRRASVWLHGIRTVRFLPPQPSGLLIEPALLLDPVPLVALVVARAAFGVFGTPGLLDGFEARVLHELARAVAVDTGFVAFFFFFDEGQFVLGVDDGLAYLGVGGIRHDDFQCLQ